MKTLTMFLAVLLIGCSGKSESIQSGSSDAQTLTAKESQAAAVAAIRQLGGRVTFDETNPGEGGSMKLQHVKLLVGMVVAASYAAGQDGIVGRSEAKKKTAAAIKTPVGIQVTKYAPKTGSFTACTQIAFNGKTEIVTAGNRLYFRKNSKSSFHESPIKGLNDAHSVAFNPHDKLFYVTDTGHHRLKTFRDPASHRIRDGVNSLAKVKLDRPHDIVVDKSNGWMYSLNPNSGHVFRFKTQGKQADVLDLSHHLGYSRALTLVGSKLYVIGSSVGAVIEIIDFDKKKYKIHKSFGKKKNAVAGSWKRTGLVLNDVAFFKGYWYATSYFCPKYSGNQNCNQNKFIRFRTWRDFKNGTWDDLSRFLPGKVVPYYLTPCREMLYIAVFSHEFPGTHDMVYQLAISK